MMFISIVTSAYNRAYRLPKLYESIIAQSDRDFEWIVVDDGSVDDTEALVKSWMDDNIIKIRYFFKENGGMHTAMNLGVSKADGLFVLKADSDDMLFENAVERVRYYYESGLWQEGGNRELCGICFLNTDAKGSVIGDRFNEDVCISDYITVRVNGGIKGDKSEVVLTEKLREAPYLELNGEKRFPTSGVWIKLAYKYDMIFANESIYIRDYLADGITKSGNREKKSPLGTSYVANMKLTKHFTWNVRRKNAVIHIKYGLLAKKTPFCLIKESNAPSLTCFFLPRGIAEHIYVKLKTKMTYRKA